MVRLFVAVGLLFIWAAPSVNCGETSKVAAKPNSLAPQEIADGWILLFDGETTFGWRTEGDVAVKDGWLKIGGNKPAKASFAVGFRAFELAAEYVDGDKAQLFSQNVRLTPDADALGKFRLTNERGGKLFGSFDVVEMRGNAGKGQHEGFAMGANHLREWWTVPFEIGAAAKGKIAVRSIKLRPLEMKGMLNGQDLAGWHEHATRKASKWTVEDKILRVRNGPGDLQTDAKWADFILQAEIKTHGKALNSGIFFRCIPGDYQNGYEAQIQNAFKDNDRTKPADYGTGAIYRRVSARKVVSNDDEWFTMTVAAQGNRIATWVNGYMTVDWTDDRPAHDNPRNGSKTGPGAISLQGHDPTTDISFRNLRIGELPGRTK